MITLMLNWFLFYKIEFFWNGLWNLLNIFKDYIVYRYQYMGTEKQMVI